MSCAPCVPSPQCVAGVGHWAKMRGPGLWVGSNLALKKLTLQLGGLLDCSTPHAPPPILVDVGAGIHNLGGYELTAQGLHVDDSDALWMLPTFQGRAEVYAFEPNGAKAAELRRAVHTRNMPRAFAKHLHVYAMGVGSRVSNSSRLLTHGPSNVWALSEESHHTPLRLRLDRHGPPTGTVMSTSLDAFLANALPPETRVLYAKVDVEGGEFAVLAGMRGLLSAGRIDVLSFEYAVGWEKLFQVTRPLTLQERASLAHTLEHFSTALGEMGYDTYLLHAIPVYARTTSKNVTLIPVHGKFWNASLEVCADRARFYRSYKHCWNDLLVIRRCSHCVRRNIFDALGGELEMASKFDTSCTCL